MIQLQNVEKGYNGESVLRGVNLTVNDGEYVSVMGRSGSGKSTLLAILGGFLQPDGGSVTWDGEDVYAMSAERMARMRCNKIGFVFQSFRLVNTLTVRDNILLPGHLSNLPRRVVWDNIERHAHDLAIESSLDKYPDELSGGQCQRAAICRALCFNPCVLILDEPTGALDAANEKVVMALLKRVNEECGTTIVQVTHSNIVAANAHRILQMTDGAPV